MSTTLLSRSASLLLLVMPLSLATGQLRNAQTISFRVEGQCAASKNQIEQAGTERNTAVVRWNPENRQATVTYDARKTSPQQVLRNIALAGYDNELYLAPPAAYQQLPDSCRYERRHQAVATTAATAPAELPADGPLASVFEAYFALNEALVASDAATAARQATTLLTRLKAVKMEKLPAEPHRVWMSVSQPLTDEARQLAASTDLSRQRQVYSSLSERMYQLMKAADPSSPVYYQHCPMANGGKGANWLSRQSTIRNPYFGSKMLTCGSTVETF